MSNRQKSIFVFGLIGLLVAGALFFVYPLKPFPEVYKDVQPWKLGLDLVGGSFLIYEVDMERVDANDRDSVIAGLRDVIERRVNLFGVAEPQVFSAQEGDSYRLIVSLAGIKDVSLAIRQIGSTPMLDFREVVEGETEGEVSFLETGLSGRYVEGAQLVLDNLTGETVVALQFNKEGGDIFEEITGRNIGKPIAVFLDDELIQVATVQQKISGGSAQISGQFTTQEAKAIVERFNAGALPAPISLINQQTISASLGADSIQKALVSGIIGTLAVALFIILYYGYKGLVASLALFIYIVLALAVFKVIGVTMTLAGIAGFLLSIGMAVDANILIFERVKEELIGGKSKIEAIEEGFRRAWTSIRDSNISTIITAIILYYFTSSFVQGFALTLLIGVLVSMFSAITVTRTMLRVFRK